MIAGPAVSAETQAMLDQGKWRDAFRAAAKAEISAGRLDRAALARHFEELKGDARVSKQAVYEWFRTGRVSDDSLNELARFLGCDPVALRMRGVFEKPTVDEPKARGPRALPDVIRDRVATLDKSIQQQILGLIETMVALSNPKLYNHEEQAHRKALAVHEGKPAPYKR